MQIIGLLGRSGERQEPCGSAVRHSGPVLDADRAGHEALRLPHVEAAARQRWGEAVFATDGRIDRAGWPALCLPGSGGQQERRYLEQLTHPEITRLLQQQADALAAAGFSRRAGRRVVVGGRVGPIVRENRICREPREDRLARALARGWSQEDFSAREERRNPWSVSARVPMR